MLTLLYNFTNTIDESITQKELSKSPEGSDFIARWTWKNQSCLDGQPRFRKSNTVEDYLYVRIIEEDALQAIGAIRLHWNTKNNLILDTSTQILQISKNYHWCEDPGKRYDLEYIIKRKLYDYLSKKMINNRYEDNDCCCHQHPNCCPTPIPYPHHNNCCPSSQYSPHNDCCEYDNVPKNGPYGGTYNAYDDICCK